MSDVHSLDDKQGNRQVEKAKVIKITLPKSNPNIKSDVDAELDNGWHLTGGPAVYHDGTNNILLYTFVKPKRK